MKCVHDLTRELNEHIPIFPGDPEFKIIQINSIKNGNVYNLHEIHLTNHTGTHIDFPRHVLEHGKTSSDFSLSNLMGEVLVIDCFVNSMQSITKKFIENYQQDILPGDFIFFKNSLFLEIDAAQFLIDLGVRIVGVDGLSVDDISDSSLDVHKLLLGHDVLIVESLDLTSIKAQRWQTSIVPLKINNIDGLPARVFIWI